MTLPPHSYMSMPIKIAGPLMNLNNSLKRQILFSSHRHERIIFPAFSRASSDRCLAIVVIILLIFHHRDQNCQHFQIFTIFDGTLTESHRVAPIKVVTMTVSNGPDCDGQNACKLPFQQSHRCEIGGVEAGTALAGQTPGIRSLELVET